jgi:hypothetical protein
MVILFLNNFFPIIHDWIPFYFMLGIGKYLGLTNKDNLYFEIYSN